MATPSIKQIAIGDLEQEIKLTRKVLERLPEEHYAWKPHEKSMSLAALGSHVANLLYWQTMTLQLDGLDLAGLPPQPAPPTSQAELLDKFDRNAAVLRETLAATDDAAFGEPWTLRSGDHVHFTLPRAAVMRSMGISHMIHHRAQLTVYLRLLDEPVPAVYGPSADERGMM